MQRVRMSLPFFKEFGWEAEIVTVDPKHSEMVKDPFFENTVPQETKIHYTKAIKKKFSGKIGLGSLALRSLWFYKTKVNSLLRQKKYDLIYFSTTQFPVCILGPYWKKKFKIPYVIDMQDPWHSDYYLDKPKTERPPKFWFSYRLNKFLEPLAMKDVDGIISVSDSYIQTLKQRYLRISNIPCEVITFGYLEEDFNLVKKNFAQIDIPFKSNSKYINLVYIGRGGFDMRPAISKLFQTFKELLENPIYEAEKLRYHFIGTSYAPNGSGTPTILPIAEEFGIQDYVVEITDRIAFFAAIKALLCADALVIPGSNDSSYTASKLYPYILAQKPLLALFNPSSSAYKIIKECNSGHVVSLTDINILGDIKTFLINLLENHEKRPNTNWELFKEYSAKNMTKKQCDLFDLILSDS
jgi:hypothetical protein